MSEQVPAGLWVAATAAVAVVYGAVAALVVRAPARAVARRTVVAELTGWLAVAVALGAAGAFAAERHRLLPGIVLGIAVPIASGLWLQARPGRVRELVEAVPLRSLIAVQTYRIAGVVFLLAWATGWMPAAFALPAGLGDIAIGLAALPTAARADDPRGRGACLVWNLAGLLDLVAAIALGALSSPSPFEALASGHPNDLISRLPFVLIPVFAVPLSILLHAAALRRLRVGERVPATTTRASRSACAHPRGSRAAGPRATRPR